MNDDTCRGWWTRGGWRCHRAHRLLAVGACEAALVGRVSAFAETLGVAVGGQG